MKLTRANKIALGLLGGALVIWVVLMLFSGGETKKQAEVDDKHCPECGHEIPRGVLENGGDCPYCQVQGRKVPVGKARQMSLARGPTIPIILISASALLLLVNIVFLVIRRVGGNKDEVLYYVSCRKCGRKLRYRQRQAGHFARCPLCQTVILFPKLPDPRRRWPAAVLGKILKR